VVGYLPNPSLALLEVPETLAREGLSPIAERWCTVAPAKRTVTPKVFYIDQQVTDTPLPADVNFREESGTLENNGVVQGVVPDENSSTTPGESRGNIYFSNYCRTT